MVVGVSVPWLNVLVTSRSVRCVLTPEGVPLEGWARVVVISTSGMLPSLGPFPPSYELPLNSLGRLKWMLA